MVIGRGAPGHEEPPRGDAFRRRPHRVRAAASEPLVIEAAEIFRTSGFPCSPYERNAPTGRNLPDVTDLINVGLMSPRSTGIEPPNEEHRGHRGRSGSDAAPDKGECGPNQVGG
ncbi:hypothetical protein BX257_4539 [Streptomyces sp. 3212.3]|nr:hypothetical protein BX257_4539 [Streptomyces sp. 3212.3]